MDNLIRDFYTSFKKLDAEGMVQLYHPEIEFEDPAFGVLKSTEACNMWRMLCESQKDKNFLLEYYDIHADSKTGSAKWEAKYTFSKTGRKILNVIQAEFEFKDGKIYRHKDNFNLYNWSIQAFGIKGVLIGWTTMFKTKLQKNTNSLLKKYIKSQS